jgi:hypothetical protein
MTKRIGLCMIVMAVVGLSLTGCMPKMTIEEMKAMMPERPVELDKLNMFAGTWEGTGEATMAGLDQVLKTGGMSKVEWGCDGWCMVEHGKYEMEEFGTMEGIGLWSYDPKAKKYRNFWVDSMGAAGTGESVYCEKTKTWKMKAKSHSSWGTSISRGTMTFPDPNTMEWTWTEYDALGLSKMMEMTGTSKKK